MMGPVRKSLAVPVGSTASSADDPVRKVLVVDLGFLGDTLHLIPALHELRRRHASAELHVVTTPIGAEVLRLVEAVDRTWEYPLGKPSPPWWRHLDLQWALARERFDLAVNFSGADRTLFVTAFAGIPSRITRMNRRGGVWRRWLAGRWIPAPSRDQPVYEQRRAVLAAAGYTLENPRFDLRLPAQEIAWANQHIPAGAVHLSINASSPFKEWPLDHWAALARSLLTHPTTRLVATGSPHPREQERLAALAAAVANPGLQILGEPLSIARLAALLQRCALHLGTDSGVTHLAMALGLPTVSVFRQYEGLEEWRPRGDAHQAVLSPCHCVDQPALRPDCAAAGTALCLARIGVAEVLRRLPPHLQPSAE